MKDTEVTGAGRVKKKGCEEEVKSSRYAKRVKVAELLLKGRIKTINVIPSNLSRVFFFF